MLSLATELGVTVVMIVHDLVMISEFASHVALINAARLGGFGPVNEARRCRSASERSSRSRRVTHNLSPGLAWSISLASSGRSDDVPETMSVKMRTAPAPSSRSCCPAAS